MKIVLLCWTCGKKHKDIPVDKPYKCECGGYVVSPSGKTQGKWIDESTAYGNDCPTGKCEWWRGGDAMKRKVASRKLQRRCIHCDCGFKKGDVYYVDRQVFEEYGDVFAVETIICTRCKYREEDRKLRYERFKERCEHPEQFVEWEYCHLPGDAVPVPSHQECRLCGKVV